MHSLVSLVSENLWGLMQEVSRRWTAVEDRFLSDKPGSVVLIKVLWYYGYLCIFSRASAGLVILIFQGAGLTSKQTGARFVLRCSDSTKSLFRLATYETSKAVSDQRWKVHEWKL